MKKLFFLFLVSFCFFKPLYAQENQNEGYILKIKKGKTLKEGTTTFLEIPVTLKNTTKDTLYYMSMSCSWQEERKKIRKKYYLVQPDPNANKKSPLIVLAGFAFY